MSRRAAGKVCVHRLERERALLLQKLLVVPFNPMDTVSLRPKSARAKTAEAMTWGKQYFEEARIVSAAQVVGPSRR